MLLTFPRFPCIFCGRILVGVMMLMGAGCQGTHDAPPVAATPLAPSHTSLLPIVDGGRFEPPAPAPGQAVRVELVTGVKGKRYQYRYIWKMDGVVVPDVTGPELPGSLTTAGTNLKVTVIPFNEEGDGLRFDSTLLQVSGVAQTTGRPAGASCEQDAQCASKVCGETSSGKQCINDSAGAGATSASIDAIVVETASSVVTAGHASTGSTVRPSSGRGPSRRNSSSAGGSGGWSASDGTRVRSNLSTMPKSPEPSPYWGQNSGWSRGGWDGQGGSAAIRARASGSSR